MIFSLTLRAQDLDQVQLNYNAGTSARTLLGYSHFQSFTAGITGMLVEIDMGVFNPINGVGTFNIYSGADTTGDLLHTSSVDVVCPGQACFTNFTTSVPITAGQVYCFRFIPGAGMPDPYGVQVENPGSYSGGQMGLIDPSGVYYPGFDQVFKTFVSASVGTVAIDHDYFDLKIYQDPYAAMTVLSTANPLTNATLVLSNLQGRTVDQIKNISGQRFTLPNKSMPSGIYLLRLTQDNRVLAIQKLVITH